MSFEVGYVTEDPAREYSKAIRSATTLPDLIKTLEHYKTIASDALARAKRLNEDDFADFRTKLKYAGRKMPDSWTENFTKKYGEIVVPIDMLMASLLSEQFHAPWGTAFIRHKELKK